jgi:hypothetical protein
MSARFASGSAVGKVSRLDTLRRRHLGPRLSAHRQVKPGEPNLRWVSRPRVATTRQGPHTSRAGIRAGQGRRSRVTRQRRSGPCEAARPRPSRGTAARRRSRPDRGPSAVADTLTGGFTWQRSINFGLARHDDQTRPNPFGVPSLSLEQRAPRTPLPPKQKLQLSPARPISLNRFGSVH